MTVKPVNSFSWRLNPFKTRHGYVFIDMCVTSQTNIRVEGQTAKISATIYVAPPTVWEGHKLDYAV